MRTITESPPRGNLFVRMDLRGNIFAERSGMARLVDEPWLRRTGGAALVRAVREMRPYSVEVDPTEWPEPEARR